MTLSNVIFILIKISHCVLKIMTMKMKKRLEVY